MLRLAFYTRDDSLKVRLALPEDDFQKACEWDNKLQFIISNSSDFMMLWSSLLPDLDPLHAEAFIELVGARYPISKNFLTLKKVCPEIVFSNPTDELVFFGGSFNPWHQGHQACLNLLPDDKVCLVVPDHNPQKELNDLKPVTKILEISNKAKFRNHHFLVPTFLLDQNKNPTVDWVEKLKADQPQLKISLLLGFDSYAGLRTWVRAKDLLMNLSTLYVVSRMENGSEKVLAQEYSEALNPKLNVLFLGKHQFESISSTEIRKLKTL